MKLYTSASVARELGMTEQEIKFLTKTGVIKYGLYSDGLYELNGTAKEIIANYRKPDDEREDVDYATERARMMRAKRLSEEYSLKERKGELHRSEDIELIMSKMLISFKAKLQALPSRIAPQAAKMSDSVEINDMIKKLVDEALTEMSNYDELFGGDNDGSSSK